MSSFTRPIGIFYEHPTWFKPLFSELEKRRIPFLRIRASNHLYNPAEREVPFNLLINRVSASAYMRGNPQGILHSANYLAHVERLGIPVINGTSAHEVEGSKAKQLEVFASLGLPFPKTRIVNHVDQLMAAARSLRFPIVVKSNGVGRFTTILRFNTAENLQRAINLGQITVGDDHTALVQEFIPTKDASIVRVETLNKKFLYAVKVYTKTESFNLRPYKRPNQSSDEEEIRVEPYTPPHRIIAEVERIVSTARLDTGAVEYVVSERDDNVYYCNLIALSNFIQDTSVVGFDPYVEFVNYIEQRLKPFYEPEPILML